MGLLDTLKEAVTGKHGIDIGNIDLPLSDENRNTLNELISKGTFKDKSDFLHYIAHAYTKNDVGSVMSGGRAPSESSIMDIITKTGLGKDFSQSDMKRLLVPLLIAGFTAVYRYMTKKHAREAETGKAALTEEMLRGIEKIDLPLTGDSKKMLDNLISGGQFKGKSDFMGFLANAFIMNNLASMMTGGKTPPESTIMDIINKSGIGKGRSELDLKKVMVPLLITGFIAIYKYMTSKKPAVKPV